jgi:hypothetical protein
MSTNQVVTARRAEAKASKLKNLLIRVLIVLLMVWVFASALIYAAMRQPPETFARIMARVPGPVAFLVLPFETLWTRARAGTLNIGDPAPDFSLATLDKSSRVELSSLLRKQPVVLVFGSYT